MSVNWESRLSILGLITARGGSKGIPDKNRKILAEKPLIFWTIESALFSNCLDRIIVSTDDKDVAQTARQFGAEVPFLRPAELAQDDSSSVDVALHALSWFSESEGYFPDYLMLLQPTSPLRTPNDIVQVVKLAYENPNAAVVSVSQTHPHPYWMKTILPNGFLSTFLLDREIPTQRQALPPVYALNGAIYLIKRKTLLAENTFLPVNTLAYIMEPENSIDIDTPWDFHLAELILRDKLGNENNQD